MRRNCLPLLLLPLLPLSGLLLPAGAHAVDPMKEAIQQKAEMDQAQREQLTKAIKELEAERAKTATAQKEEKPFPGPVQQTQQPQQQGAAVPSGKPAGGPKSTKPIYGDIIIHK
jgi:hypothetical protein